MRIADLLDRLARSDRTFELRGALWVGKCLICNGPIAFDRRTGSGATVEHIRARTRGGTDDLENLAAVHSACNHEKGLRWDPRKKKRDEEYEAFIGPMLERRRERLRPETVEGGGAGGRSAGEEPGRRSR
jgi:5-methylcytosine-specific restriction endonuclease McrA